MATDRQFLPSQLMAEPAEAMAVILELDSYFRKIQKMNEEPDLDYAPE